MVGVGTYLSSPEPELNQVWGFFKAVFWLEAVALALWKLVPLAFRDKEETFVPVSENITRRAAVVHRQDEKYKPELPLEIVDFEKMMAERKQIAQEPEQIAVPKPVEITQTEIKTETLKPKTMSKEELRRKVLFEITGRK